MRKSIKVYFLLIATLTMLVAGAFGGSFMLAHASQRQASTGPQVGSGQPLNTGLASMHVVNMSSVPSETATSSSHHPTVLPLRTSVSSAVYAQRKAAALHNTQRPVANHIYPALTGGTYTPTTKTSFQGMADSASICPYFGGCQPPDMALAASTSWVLQGVNTSFAVYSTSGALQAGWPKSAQNFFGVPNPGACDPAGPFLSDPRAFYDTLDKRYWVAMLQVEGAFGLNSCPFQSRYWIAVSQTNDPRGAWNVYSFDMAAATTNAADYTQFGFDGQAIYFSGNMFNQSGTIYEYAEIFGAKKSTMESGSGVTAYGFRSLSVGGIIVDTVQPVEAQTFKNSGPRAGLFISSFNMDGDPFGDNCYSTACHGYVVWALSNPGTATTGISGVLASGSNYILAPSADEPGHPGSIETLDTRISGTPVYHDGLISFALETGVYNGSQTVPGILWGQVVPLLNDNATLASASVFQNGYYAFAGDGAASFGALMPDGDGNLFMVFEFMSSSVNPEVAYVSRRATYSLGLFHDNGKVLRSGDAPTLDSRWGDYEATSYDSFDSNYVWFAGQYSASNGDWSTFIGKDQFTFSQP